MSTFVLAMPWWHFVLRGIGAYLALLIMLRIVGRHSFSDMSTFDIVVLVLIGGTLRNTIIGPDNSFQGGLIAVASILAADRVLAWLCTRSPRLNRLVEGKPTVLVHEGELVPGALERVSLPKAAFRRALHTQGLEDIQTISTARLEPNGRITLIRKRAS
ncbi:DUF421 domain-containing protein [Dyella monticola]|uniref:DUF421 domain-containing protein n=1 Tax=Dyella monticola TaxID=1927958 RepID=A0A370WXD5_9GAMM|nr:YetF domain-containing protein [Dyella monticola]RDS80772.1 DUF421 domain-containing protein [Dyella monticola]